MQYTGSLYVSHFDLIVEVFDFHVHITVLENGEIYIFQVRIITEVSEDEMINGAKQMGKLLRVEVDKIYDWF